MRGTKNSQYIRKETIEIHKFPKDFPDNEIEAKVLEIFNEVIVKLTHRKRMRAIIKSRSKLANKVTQTKLQVGRVY